jgi:hypothetical protein
MNKFSIGWKKIKNDKYEHNLLKKALIAYGGFVVFCYVYTIATVL